MKMKSFLMIFSVTLLFAGGCIPNKKLIYVQDLQSDAPRSRYDQMIPYKIEEYVLQVNDVIDINMTTSDLELNGLLRPEGADGQPMRMMGGGMMANGDIFFLNGYTLNDKGIVDLPLVGEVKLAGLTIDEAKVVIRQELSKYIRDQESYVRVRLGGIRYSALGEFNAPGKYTLLQNRVTIFEAIANAGDLTLMAKRNKIRLIRQYPGGSKSYEIDLHKSDFMNSELYFIRPNDMIYAEPIKARELGTGVTVFQTTQLLISLATIGLLIYATTN
jgi:polysaccharide biosynthesis/export protein